MRGDGAEAEGPDRHSREDEPPVSPACQNAEVPEGGADAEEHGDQGYSDGDPGGEFHAPKEGLRRDKGCPSLQACTMMRPPAGPIMVAGWTPQWYAYVPVFVK